MIGGDRLESCSQKSTVFLKEVSVATAPTEIRRSYYLWGVRCENSQDRLYVPVQTTLLDDTRVECSGREVATQHSQCFSLC